jgi:hypothetical protein
MGRPLKIAKAQAVLTITSTAAGLGAAVTVSQNLSQPTSGVTSASGQGILPGMSFIVATTVGGLVAGTTYYVNEILSNFTFNVSLVPLSVQPASLATLTAAGPVTVAASVNVVDYGFSNPNNTDTSFPTGPNQSYGVVGGNTGIYGKQVLARVAIPRNGTGTISTSTSSTTVTGVGTSFLSQLVAGSALSVNGVFIGYLMFAPTSNTSLDLFIPPSITVSGQSFVYADDEPGFIVRQKAKSKYLVYGTTTGLTAQCSLTNTLLGPVLRPGEMFIQSTPASGIPAPVAALNDYNSSLYPATVAPSALVIGTLYTIYSSGNTDWAVCGSASMMTGVSFIARAVGTGTGLAVLADVNPDVIATFGTAYSAGASYPGSLPVVTIASA